MKRRVPTMGREGLAAEIANLSNARIDELRDRWKAIYGRPPSPEIGRSFLTRVVTHRLQERACGGLKPSTCRFLAKAIEEIATGSSKRPQTRMAQSGTILIREWQGSALRSVRARGDRRANSRQDRRLQAEGHVDGWSGADRLRRDRSAPRHKSSTNRNGPRDLPGLPGTRFRSAPDGRSEPPRHPIEVRVPMTCRKMSAAPGWIEMPISLDHLREAQHPRLHDRRQPAYRKFSVG